MAKVEKMTGATGRAAGGEVGQIIEALRSLPGKGCLSVEQVEAEAGGLLHEYIKRGGFSEIRWNGLQKAIEPHVKDGNWPGVFNCGAGYLQRFHELADSYQWPNVNELSIFRFRTDKDYKDFMWLNDQNEAVAFKKWQVVIRLENPDVWETRDWLFAAVLFLAAVIEAGPATAAAEVSNNNDDRSKRAWEITGKYPGIRIAKLAEMLGCCSGTRVSFLPGKLLWLNAKKTKNQGA